MVLLVKVGDIVRAFAGNAFVTAELAIVNAAKVPTAAFCSSWTGLAAFGTTSAYTGSHNVEWERKL